MKFQLVMSLEYPFVMTSLSLSQSRKYCVHFSYSLPFVDCLKSEPVFPNIKTVIDWTKTAPISPTIYITTSCKLGNVAALFSAVYPGSSLEKYLNYLNTTSVLPSGPPSQPIRVRTSSSSTWRDTATGPATSLTWRPSAPPGSKSGSI